MQGGKKACDTKPRAELVQWILDPAATWENVQEKNEGVGKRGRKQKSQNVKVTGRLAGWARLGGLLSTGSWEGEGTKGNRLMARNWLQWPQAWLISHCGSRELCLSPWNATPFIKEAALQLLNAGVKWKSGGSPSPLPFSVSSNATLPSGSHK